MHKKSDEPDWWGAELLARQPDDTPWAQGGNTVTYRRMRAQVAALRRLFEVHGIRADGTVALQGTHSFTYLWSLFALWSLGAQVMLMGPGVRGRELGRLLDRCSPQFYVSFGAPGSNTDTFHEECEVFVRRLVGSRPTQVDHCLVQFTSGSTGFAKAIGRSPEALLNELDTFQRIDGMPEAGSRVMVLGSMAHSFTLTGGVLHNMSVGAVSVFPRRTTPPALLDTTIRADADTILGAPRHFTALARVGRTVRTPRLLRAISGGDRLEQRVYDRFTERYGLRIGQAYGTTETGIIAADPTGRFGPDTVGMVVSGVNTRFMNGEVQVRMDRTPYLNEEAPPARFLVEDSPPGPGWLCTRDRAEIDASSGALRVLGRVDALADRRRLTRGSERALLASRTAGRKLTPGGRPIR